MSNWHNDKVDGGKINGVCISKILRLLQYIEKSCSFVQISLQLPFEPLPDQASTSRKWTFYVKGNKTQRKILCIRRYKVGWMVKGEGKGGKVAGLIPSANKN